jgi:hypothetical protein
MRETWVVGAIVLSLALGACGGPSDEGVATLGNENGDEDGSATEQVDPEEAQLAFAECMREHGVDVPDPAPRGGTGGGQILIGPGQRIDEENFEEADAACRHHLEGVFDEPSDEELQEMQDGALAFARCMRENGVEDHPDPKFENGGTTLEISADDVMDDPDFEAAEEECRKHLPGAGFERAGS